MAQTNSQHNFYLDIEPDKNFDDFKDLKDLKQKDILKNSNSNSNLYLNATTQISKNLNNSANNSANNLGNHSKKININENIAPINLGHLTYHIPCNYLNQHFIKAAKSQSTVTEIPFMLCLDTFASPNQQLFKNHVLKTEVEIGYIMPDDRDCQHFLDVWKNFYWQKSERKANYFFQNLYGYQWGRLSDLIEWFGLIEMDFTESVESSEALKPSELKKTLSKVSIPIYAKTTDSNLRVFICWAAESIVIDFNIPNYKLSEMMQIAEKMIKLVYSWKFKT